MSLSPPFSLLEFKQKALNAIEALYGRPEAEAHLRLLLEHVLGQNYRLAGGFTADQAKEAESLLVQILEEVPIQHLIGQAHFYGRDFTVSSDVLIPRPETEGLVVWARDECLRMSSIPLRILDAGTGSGCIPISLELELTEKDRTSEIIGLDVSEAALQIARENAQSLSSHTQFQQMDLLAAAPNAFQHLDLLISNPPYIPQKEQAEMRRQVTDHEPSLALFVPDHDPLLFYRTLGELGKNWLRKGGLLMVEIHMDYGPATKALFVDQGYEKVELRQDLAGRDRMVKAVLG